MRIGVIGGTFNPIHNTHLDIARATRDQFSLDRVIFVPARTPPHKLTDLTLVSPEHRLRMVQLAVALVPGAEVSNLEILRQGPSYTLDTLAALKQRFGPKVELFFILGTDQALELPSWYRAAELVRLCRLVCVERPRYPLKSLDKLAGLLPDDVLRSLRADVLVTPPSTTSATEIRRRIAAGEDAGDLLPQPVLQYIIEHGLYRGRP
jgi:nicotinate-nucleotide adenylyltransferase